MHGHLLRTNKLFSAVLCWWLDCGCSVLRCPRSVAECSRLLWCVRWKLSLSEIYIKKLLIFFFIYFLCNFSYYQTTSVPPWPLPVLQFFAGWVSFLFSGVRLDETCSLVRALNERYESLVLHTGAECLSGCEHHSKVVRSKLTFVPRRSVW